MSGTMFDLVVLGGGSGGYAAALRASQLGLSVALVEEGKLGGTCLHMGCIPTKALLHAAEVADTIRSAGGFGVHASLDRVDLVQVQAYKDGVVDRLYKGLSGLVAGRGVTLVSGRGRLVAPNTVRVDGVDYTAGRGVVLATGARAREVPGLAIEGRVVTSTEALLLTEIPDQVVVLGGGVIGVEFASIWRSLGVEVTIVEALPRLVPNEESVVSQALERSFRKRRIKVRTNARMADAVQTEAGVTVTLEGGDEIVADLLLVAIGRAPCTEDQGFEEVGVTLQRGFVEVDERLMTKALGVYAVGDIVAGLQLAHRGFQQGIFVAEEIAGLEPNLIDDSLVPRVTYSDPEIASVGVTEQQAVAALGADRVECIDYNLAGNGKSQILETAGFIKLVREKDGPVLGIHMIGARVGELVGEAQLAVGWEAFPEDVTTMLHAHPTQNEALGEAFLALAGTPLHAHS